MPLPRSRRASPLDLVGGRVVLMPVVMKVALVFGLLDALAPVPADDATKSEADALVVPVASALLDNELSSGVTVGPLAAVVGRALACALLAGCLSSDGLFGASPLINSAAQPMAAAPPTAPMAMISFLREEGAGSSAMPTGGMAPGATLGAPATPRDTLMLETLSARSGKGAMRTVVFWMRRGLGLLSPDGGAEGTAAMTVVWFCTAL